MERCYRKSRPNHDSESSSLAQTQAQSMRTPEKERSQPQPTYHDFSHVDLFSHAPQRPPVQMKLTAGTYNAHYEQEVEPLGVSQRAHRVAQSMPDAAFIQRKDEIANEVPPIQRKIIELWNVTDDKPTKKAGNKYANLIKQNWSWVSNDILSYSIASHLIKTLIRIQDLETLVGSTRISKDIYEYYKGEDKIYTLLNQLELGATLADLRIGIEFLKGDKTRPTAENLEWWNTNHPASVRLSWRKWFPYTKNNTWDPPTYDPEISVSIGSMSFGRIHMHYGRYQDATEGNINSIHIKPLFTDENSPLDDAWKARCHVLVDIASRPPIPALAIF
ncbi:MAG: hypothetical protein NW220_02585 [Leptolyngbyaceae cyanobacterium bins.349]|nr:hypothetical protein [Leptolyngbyaceae cyanobacterium bins.349]